MSKKTAKSKLAILGGKPVRKEFLKEVHNINKEELEAVKKVILDGPLSGFLGTYSKRFFGGKNVLDFEKLFSKKFGVRHALSFNSATTALHAALVAIKVGPGDEVIVPPFSMSATATVVLMNGAVPVFADIDPDTFCIDPKSIKKMINKNTKAIIAVNLFGQSADYEEIFKIINRKKIKVIEDNAQAIGAKHNSKLTGTVADIGVFSLNVHKHIQVGEGGVLVTNNDDYALRAQLARNHGEVVVDQMPNYNLGPIIGSNYRLSEIHAAMAIVQLKKLNFINKERMKLVKYFFKKMKKIDGITLPHTNSNNTHVFYRLALKIDEEVLGISRYKFVKAMNAEGFNMTLGYVKPIYLLPVFQQQKAFNNTNFPFVFDGYDGKPNYKKGICPVVEEMHDKVLTLTDVCQFPYTYKDVDMFFEALYKVLESKEILNEKNII